MKNEKGITLAALTIYILIFTLTLAVLANLTNYIYSNLHNVDSGNVSAEEFNKFNSYFVPDVKESKDVTITSDDNTITIQLSNGGTYTYVKSENTIYKDKVKIAKKVVKFEVTRETVDSGNVTKNVVNITIATGKNTDDIAFQKNIKYVLRYW